MLDDPPGQLAAVEKLDPDNGALDLLGIATAGNPDAPPKPLSDAEAVTTTVCSIAPYCFRVATTSATVDSFCPIAT